MTATFRYDPAIVERFPALAAGIVYATDLRNGPAPNGLIDACRDEQQAVVERLENLAIAEHPSIAAWRRAFSACGVKPTQYRVAAEALLRRLDKHGDIPSINLLVDLANLVSIRHAMPVAVFDQGAVTGATTVRLADGDERFTDLGASDPVNPESGEVIFVDDAGLVSARRWCWRQSAQSATGATTTRVLITVEGLHDTAPQDVAAAVEDLEELLGEYQPQAGLSSRLLSAATVQVAAFDTGDR